jgi:hypothetical protein
MTHCGSWLSPCRLCCDPHPLLSLVRCPVLELAVLSLSPNHLSHPKAVEKTPRRSQIRLGNIAKDKADRDQAPHWKAEVPSREEACGGLTTRPWLGKSPGGSADRASRWGGLPCLSVRRRVKPSQSGSAGLSSSRPHAASDCASPRRRAFPTPGTIRVLCGPRHASAIRADTLRREPVCTDRVNTGTRLAAYPRQGAVTTRDVSQLTEQERPSIGFQSGQHHHNTGST